MSPEQVAARAKAIEIGAVLTARGLPVIAVSELDCGHKIGVAFQLDGAMYGVRCPADQATPEWFEDAFRVVA